LPLPLQWSLPRLRSRGASLQFVLTVCCCLCGRFSSPCGALVAHALLRSVVPQPVVRRFRFSLVFLVVQLLGCFVGARPRSDTPGPGQRIAARCRKFQRELHKCFLFHLWGLRPALGHLLNARDLLAFLPSARRKSCIAEATSRFSTRANSPENNRKKCPVAF
jgi:hypothetical protein